MLQLFIPSLSVSSWSQLCRGKTRLTLPLKDLFMVTFDLCTPGAPLTYFMTSGGGGGGFRRRFKLYTQKIPTSEFVAPKKIPTFFTQKIPECYLSSGKKPKKIPVLFSWPKKIPASFIDPPPQKKNPFGQNAETPKNPSLKYVSGAPGCGVPVTSSSQ